MKSEHNIDALRTLLKALHDKIEALENRVVVFPVAATKLRKRIEDAKRHETEILAKLSKGGVKL